MRRFLDGPTKNAFHGCAPSEILACNPPEDISCDASSSIENKEEDLFSLLMNIETLDQQRSDTSSDSVVYPVNPVKDDIMFSLDELLNEPFDENYSLMERDSLKGKAVLEGNCTISNKKDPSSYTLKRKYPTMNERDGNGVVIGPTHPHTQRMEEIGNGPGFNGAGLGRLIEVGMSVADATKAMANARLAELALTNPKMVKRTLANRKSAALSKEKKRKYVKELEIKVHRLRADSINLQAKLEHLEKDANALTLKNNQLRMHVEALEREKIFHSALTKALEAEVQRLKDETCEILQGKNNGTGVVPMNHNLSVQLNNGLPQNPIFFYNTSSRAGAVPMNPNRSVQPNNVLSQNPIFFHNTCPRADAVPMNPSLYVERNNGLPQNHNFFYNTSPCASSVPINPKFLANQQMQQLDIIDLDP